MNTHTLVLQAENCKDAIGESGQPMIRPRDYLRATPLYSFTHQRSNRLVRSVLAPINLVTHLVNDALGFGKERERKKQIRLGYFVPKINLIYLGFLKPMYAVHATTLIRVLALLIGRPQGS